MAVRWVMAVAVLFGLTCGTAQANTYNLKSEGASQVLLVLSKDSLAKTGRLLRFGRNHGRFVQEGPAIRVALGRNGLGWGRGRHPLDVAREFSDAPVKKEGDGKSPAGVFRLSNVMGYAATAPAGSALPYQQATPTTECVDDQASPDYNRIIDAGPFGSQKPWKSSEKMLRPDVLYRNLIVVDHNAERPVPGGGSCVFMHIWKGPEVGTAGCTAMDEQDLVRVIRWLKPGKHPILVQLTEEDYRRLQARWELPALTP